MKSSRDSLMNKKVISIGTVCELTGLSERQIRYYEEKQLVFPERVKGGIRKYSFFDVERLMDIANKREEGVQTAEIKRELNKENVFNDHTIREKELRGQLNAFFHKGSHRK